MISVSGDYVDPVQFRANPFLFLLLFMAIVLWFGHALSNALFTLLICSFNHNQHSYTYKSFDVLVHLLLMFWLDMYLNSLGLGTGNQMLTMYTEHYVRQYP